LAAVETEVGGIGEVSVYPATAKDRFDPITFVTFEGNRSVADEK
jgi:hypothetical protein